MIIKLKGMLVSSPLGGVAQKGASTIKRKLATVRRPELDSFYRDSDYLDRLLPTLIKPDSHCIDIGCHIGSVLKQFTDLAPKGSHMAVEPTPAKAVSLRNRFPDVTIHECALSNAPGEAVFHEDVKRAGYSHLAYNEDDAAAPEIHAYTVKVRTLDEICKQSEHVSFIKIDVEGGEQKVLEGGAATIEKFRPVIIFECGPVATETDHNFSGDVIYKLLTDTHGYNIYAAIDLVFEREALSLEAFRRYRTYPFVALNFIAIP